MTSEAGRNTTGTHRLDLSHAAWRKSSHSQGQGNNCVEVAKVNRHVAIRDSKNLVDATLVFGQAEWRAFLTEVKHGKLPL